MFINNQASDTIALGKARVWPDIISDTSVDTTGTNTVSYC